MPASPPRVAPTQTLLRALVHVIDESKAAGTHLRETDEFLDGIRDHFLWYDGVLQAVGAPDFDSVLADDTIGEISKVVYKVVPYVKGLSEGTTDHIPFSLAALLSHELKVATAKEVGVAFCPVPELNYYYLDFGQLVLQAFMGLDTFIAEQTTPELAPGQLADPPSLPSSLILIAFQYAMAEDVLFNSVLLHELGHHVYTHHKWEDEHRPLVAEALHHALIAGFPPYKASHMSGDGKATKLLRASVDVMVRWVKELCSDCYAAALAGPQYCFAISDLFRLKDRPRPKSFSGSHPAELLRVHEQYLTLQQAGWLEPPEPLRDTTFAISAREVFATLAPEPLPEAKEDWSVDWLERAGIPRLVAEIMIDQIMGMGDDIRTRAVGAVAELERRCLDFWWLGAAVQDAMGDQAIVPSTVVLDEDLSARGVNVQPGGVDCPSI